MKILYITDPVIDGGATRSLVDVASSMVKKGIECTVCISSHSELEKELNDIGVKCLVTGHMAAMEVMPRNILKRPLFYVLRKSQYKKALKKAIEVVEKEGVSTFDLIHTNSARNDLGCALSKKHNVRHIVHLREFGDADFGCSYYRKNYVSFLNETTQRFIAISHAVAEYWIKKGIDRDKVTVIYNGVDSDSIEERAADNERKALKMVIVGGICEAKGQMQIIDAIGRLPDDIKENVFADIIGWGDVRYINAMKNRAKKLGISGQVEFFGARKDIYSILKNYDVGLMCSKSEGFGRVTVEYMHAGLAVIASDTGANMEIVENNLTGQIYEYNNADELKDCIIRYYNDREFLSSCAKRGKEHALKHYTKQINAENIYKLYMKETEK